MNNSRFPLLYQLNTRVYLTALGEKMGRPATLDDIPDDEIDRWKRDGFEWIWLLSVWQTGPTSKEVSRNNPHWRQEFAETLDDLRDEDIGGSGFAIIGYDVHESLGGNHALARLRKRLGARDLRLMLDFVPNHMGLGHPWLYEHPNYFVAGSEVEQKHAPQNYLWATTKVGEKLLAHGRDPYFPGWPDTLQLNYGNPELRNAMVRELLRISKCCDGVRCDMAMLVLPEVFERTWGIHMEPFWPEAIERVRKRQPRFTMMAEVYWDMEWILQQQGFDYTYDKKLYDRLREGNAAAVRDHLLAGLDYQTKMARFLENHDEARAAVAFAPAAHQAAAVISYLTPGLRFFHQGQCAGWKKRVSPHLTRGPREETDAYLQTFYERLLSVLRLPLLRDGHWQLLEAAPAWEGNTSNHQFVAFAWHGSNQERIVIAVNYGPLQGQCRARFPFADLTGRNWRLHDLFSDAMFERSGDEITNQGLYVDLPPWGFHVFSLRD